MVDGDGDSTLDTTVDEEDNAPESKDHEHQVRRMRVLKTDLSGEEIVLTEDVRVLEPTENDPSDTHNPQKESEETATQDNTDTKIESSPNFYRERDEAAEPDLKTRLHHQQHRSLPQEHISERYRLHKPVQFRMSMTKTLLRKEKRLVPRILKRNPKR